MSEDQMDEEIEGLTIERNGEVMAHVQHFGRAQELEVIQRLGLTERQWVVAGAAWMNALVEESMREEQALSRRFCVAFAETRARLKRERPTLPSLGTLHSERQVATIAMTELEPAPAPTPARPLELPTYEIAARAPDAALLASTDVPERRWPRLVDVQGGFQTADVDITVFRGPPLPFALGAPPPAFFAAADAVRGQMRVPPANATGHETMVLPAMDASALKDATEAGDCDTVDTGRAALTIEQYAAFCAELAVFPGGAGDICRKYGVAAPVARAALDDAFVREFQADPTTHSRWRALVEHYKSWYRGQIQR